METVAIVVPFTFPVALSLKQVGGVSKGNASPLPQTVQIANAVETDKAARTNSTCSRGPTHSEPETTQMNLQTSIPPLTQAELKSIHQTACRLVIAAVSNDLFAAHTALGKIAN